MTDEPAAGTREPTAGFSLIEVLVVLALIGTMAGLTMLSLGSRDRGDRPEAEARLLASRLSLATDDALLTDRELSVRFDASGYGVDLWSTADNAWHQHPNGLLGTRHDVAEGVAMNVEPSLPRLAIRPDAFGGAVAVTFSASGDAWDVVSDGMSARAAQVTR